MTVLERSTVGRLREALADYDPRTPVGFLQDIGRSLNEKPVFALIPVNAIHMHIVDGAVVFASVDLGEVAAVIQKPATSPGVYPCGDTSIGDLSLAPRTCNTLCRAGILTIKELASLTEHQLYALRGVGPKTLKEIVARLAEYGLALKKGETP